MPAQFDWQTEDEDKWGDFEPEHEIPSVKRWPRRRLVIVVLALLLLVSSAVAGFVRIERFLDKNNDRAEQDVLNSHALAMAAAEEGDAELLDSLILDRLQEWTQAQVALAESDLLLDRWPMELYLPADAEPASFEVELLPNLRDAEVNVEYQFRVGSDELSADSVMLRQLFSYRKQDEQWLLNPPTGAFWGPWKSTGGRHLILRYPQRDEQIGQRLAADLEAIVGQTCNSIEALQCPADLRMEVELVADPNVLISLSDPTSRLAGGRHIALPTPTLLGFPVDESAYRALYRAYAQRIVSRLIAEQTNMPSMDQRALFAIVLQDVILERLGLRNGPDVTMSRPTGSDELLIQAGALWDSASLRKADLEGASRQIAYALAEFLVNEWSDVPPADMLRSLSHAANLREWIGMLEPATSDLGFAEAWESFVAQKHPDIEPIIWPDEVILLMCDQGIVGSSNLYLYDPAEELLRIETSGREFIRMEALPDGAGVVLTEQSIRQQDQRTYLWQAGRIIPFAESGEGLGALESVDDRRLALARPSRQNETLAWSSDGDWLAELDDSFLILSAPAEGYRRVVEHGARDCRALAWVQAGVEGTSR